MTLAAARAEEGFRLGVLLAQIDTCLAMSASPHAVTQQEWDRLRALRDAYDDAAEALSEAMKAGHALQSAD